MRRKFSGEAMFSKEVKALGRILNTAELKNLEKISQFLSVIRLNDIL